MNVSVFLGVSFLLSLCWGASGLEPAVTSMCSNDWLITRIKRRPFENNTEIRKGEIHLGKNCAVTRTLTFSYEFSYPVIYCGISKLLFQGNDVFILSEITYRPTLDITHKFHVVCFVKRFKESPLLPFGMNGYEVQPLFMSDVQGTREGQQPEGSSQSQMCDASFHSSHQDQLPVNHWASSGCVQRSPHP